jgi:hypothetical protein
MLDAFAGHTRGDELRRFAVACYESVWDMLDESARASVKVAARLARGEATEAERVAAEQEAFWFSKYQEYLDKYYYADDYEAFDGRKYETDRQFAAAEAVAGALCSEPLTAAKVAARSALEASSDDVARAQEQIRLCGVLRSIVSFPSHYTREGGDG